MKPLSIDADGYFRDSSGLKHYSAIDTREADDEMLRLLADAMAMDERVVAITCLLRPGSYVSELGEQVGGIQHVVLRYVLHSRKGLNEGTDAAHD